MPGDLVTQPDKPVGRSRSKVEPSPVKKVQCPVLMFHGLGDTALLAPALNGTWDWIDKDLTLTTVPGAGHFVQADAAELVTRTMRAWLLR